MTLRARACIGVLILRLGSKIMSNFFENTVTTAFQIRYLETSVYVLMSIKLSAKCLVEIQVTPFGIKVLNFIYCII